jgi:hypothetical protein
MDNQLLRLRVVKTILEKENKSLRNKNSKMKTRIRDALLENKTDKEKLNIMLFFLNNNDSIC